MNISKSLLKGYNDIEWWLLKKEMEVWRWVVFIKFQTEKPYYEHPNSGPLVSIGFSNNGPYWWLHGVGSSCRWTDNTLQALWIRENKMSHHSIFNGLRTTIKLIYKGPLIRIEFGVRVHSWKGVGHPWPLNHTTNIH